MFHCIDNGDATSECGVPGFEFSLSIQTGIKNNINGG